MGIEVASSFTRKAAVPLDDSSVVETLLDRDSIVPGIRYHGMTVFVRATDTRYILRAGLTDSDWEEDSGSGGGGGGFGSGLNWVFQPGREPYIKVVQGFKLASFPPSSNSQSMYVTFRLPPGFKTGVRLALKGVAMNGASSSHERSIKLRSMRYTGDWTDPFEQSETHTNNFWQTDSFYAFSLYLNDSDGEIEGSPLYAGDLIQLELSRDFAPTDEDPADLDIVIESLTVEIEP